MAGHAADLLPVAEIVMNNKNVRHDGLQYATDRTECSGLEAILPTPTWCVQLYPFAIPNAVISSSFILAW